MVASEIGNKKAPAINAHLLKKVEEAIADTSNDDFIMQSIETYLPQNAGTPASRKEVGKDFVKLKHTMLTAVKNLDHAGRNLNSKAEAERLSTTMFTKAFYILRSNSLLIKLDMPTTMLVAQQMTNQLMMKYSPYAEVKGRYDDIINNYAIRNDSILKSALTSLRLNVTYFDQYKKALLANQALQNEISAVKKSSDAFKSLALSNNQALCFAVKENYVVNDNTLQAFKKMFEIKIDDKKVTSAVKKTASAILNGVVEERLMSQTTSRFYNMVSVGFEKVYENLAVYAKHGATLDEMMNYTARSAFEICYNYLNQYDVTREKQAVLAQQLANLVINNYSPVSFTNEVANEKYADFVTKDSALLSSTVEKLEPERIATKEMLQKEAERARIKAEEAKKNAEKQAEYDRKSAEERQRQREEEEAQKAAKREAELEVKRSYQREIANPVAIPQKIDSNFVRACKAELVKSLDDPKTQEAFKLTVAKILESYGIEKKEATIGAIDIYDKVRGVSNGIRKAYDKLESDVEFGVYQDFFVPKMMNFLMESHCKSVVNKFEDPQVGVIAAHDVIGAIIKHYSPVAFTKDDAFKKLADDYLLKDGGKEYYNSYFNTNRHFYDIPSAKRVKFDNVEQFYSWIREGVKRFDKTPEMKSVAKYERKANRMQMNETELMGPNSIDFAMKECKLSFEDPKLTEYVKAQIGKILLEGGADQYKIQETVDKLFNKLSGENGMLKLYSKSQYNMFKSTGGHLYNQKDFMDTIMNYTVEYFGADAVACFTSVEQGIVANQKIMDLIVKNYSPVPFTTGGTLEKHANDYLFKDNGVAYLKAYYDFCSPENVMTRFKNEEEFIAKVSATMEKANKQNSEKASPVTEDKNSQREKITVDLNNVVAEAPKQGESKVEAPKVEASNPNRERLVIEELANDTRAKDVSEKVKESDVPVTSKAKN